MVIRSLDQLTDMIRRAKRIAVCGHVNPDGDCLGSVAALSAGLEAAGHEVTRLFAENDTVSSLEFALDDYQLFRAPADFQGDIDLFFAVDVPNVERLGEAAAIFEAAPATIMVDHHPDTRDEADLVYSDPSAAATGLIVWELFKALGITPDENMASACYVALLTDTGRFQYQNTDARCFRYAAEFLEAGVNPGLVATRVYQNRSFASLKLQQRLVERMTITDNGLVAYSWISDEDMEELAATKDDAEDLTDVLRSIRGVQACAMLRAKEGEVRVSLRAKNKADVGSIARQLGGGGHKAAAGATFHGTVEECIATLRPLLESIEDE